MRTKLIDKSKKKRVHLNSEDELCYNLAPIEEGFYPRDEYYSRYPAIIDMADPKRFDSYFRSDKKKLKGVKITEAKFQGNQESIKPYMYPKTGNFYNPFHFESYKQCVNQKEFIDEIIEPASWYDRLLNYQKKMASYVVQQVSNRNDAILLNADYGYSCILLKIPKPSAEKNDSTWTQFISVYFIALVNKLASERGINIEIHRRSSFDHLRPSVAECGESLRISLGLSPKDYANCIIDGIIYLKKIFDRENSFKVPFCPSALNKTLAAYNKKKNKNIALKNSLWNTLWAAGDGKGCSFASQIFRKPETVEFLINSILDVCLERNLDTIFARDTLFKEAFVKPLMHLFEHFTLNDKTLSLVVPSPLKCYSWKKEAQIKDDEYWSFVEDYALHLGASNNEVKCIIEHKRTTYLFCFFEHLLKDFFFTPKEFESAEDGCGSESYEEDSLILSKDKTQAIYAKKMITATGMRAIQLIYAAGKTYLFKEHDIDPSKISFTADLMYYETEDALKKFSIPLDIDYASTKNKTRQNIGFFDLNHCNTTQAPMKRLLSKVGNNDFFCVVDVTSATSKEINTILKKLFSERANLKVVTLVSSGLKNEQGMSDYNPYGTVRIFSKTAHALEMVYDKLLELEQEAEYEHPKISHLLRKTAKYYGMVPTNQSILGISPN